MGKTTKDCITFIQSSSGITIIGGVCDKLLSFAIVELLLFEFELDGSIVNVFVNDSEGSPENCNGLKLNIMTI